MFSTALFINFAVSSCFFTRRSVDEGAASSAGKSTHYCLRMALEGVKGLNFSRKQRDQASLYPFSCWV